MGLNFHSTTAMLHVLLCSTNKLTCRKRKLVQSVQCSRHLLLQPGCCPLPWLFCNFWVVKQRCSQRQE